MRFVTRGQNCESYAELPKTSSPLPAMLSFCVAN